jgi:hypothetical protein
MLLALALLLRFRHRFVRNRTGAGSATVAVPLVGKL